MLRDLRYGRGLDNRRLKAAGYSYRYTTREAVQKLRAQQRLRPLLRSGNESYQYEREVEEFLRWSPSVHGADGSDSGSTEGGNRSGDPTGEQSPDAAVRSLDRLTEGELLDVIPSLETTALEQLHSYEAARGRRPQVVDALERQLARRDVGRN